MGSTSPRWISDYNYASWYQNRKRGISHVPAAPKSKQALATQEWAFFDDKWKDITGHKLRNGDTKYYGEGFNEALQLYRLAQNDTLLEIQTPSGRKASFPCALDDFRVRESNLDYSWDGALPYRERVSSYRIYKKSDPTTTILSGTPLDFPVPVKAAFKFTAPKQLEWKVSEDGWGSDLFYSIDAGATWKWFQNGSNGEVSYQVEEDITGKELLILLVTSKGKKSEALVFNASTGQLKSADNFWRN